MAKPIKWEGTAKQVMFYTERNILSGEIATVAEVFAAAAEYLRAQEDTWGWDLVDVGFHDLGGASLTLYFEED